MSDIQTIKYRLIGAGVIVVSLLLAWWLLLDHEVYRHQSQQAEIPQPMEIERFEVEKPEQPPMVEPQSEVALETQVPAEASQDKSTDEEAVITEVESKLDESGQVVAWVIQVAGFEKETNAVQFKDKLQAENYPAYVKLFKLPQGDIYRVLIGPKLSKERAETIAAEVKAKFGQQGIVQRFKAGFEE